MEDFPIEGISLIYISPVLKAAQLYNVVITRMIGRMKLLGQMLYAGIEFKDFIFLNLSS